MRGDDRANVMTEIGHTGRERRVNAGGREVQVVNTTEVVGVARPVVTLETLPKDIALTGATDRDRATGREEERTSARTDDDDTRDVLIGRPMPSTLAD